ncbi:ABC transporter permease [Labrys miyagiensis]
MSEQGIAPLGGRVFNTLAGPARMVLILALIVLAFSVARFDAFASFANLRNIGMAAAILLVMSVGATYVIVTAGVDLSVGAVLVFSGVIAAQVMQYLGGEGWGVALAGLIAACIAGTGWGVINGLLVAKARIPALIATLGTMGAAQGLAWIIAGEDLKDVPTELGDTIGVGDFYGVPVIVVIAAVVTIVGGVWLAATRFGRHALAIGSNPLAAREMGIPVDRHLIRIYALAGLLAGFAGLLSLARYGSTTMSGHATDNLSVIAAVVIGGTSLFGGRGSVFGTAVGVLIPATLENGLIMVDLSTFWRDVMVGVVLILAVYLDQLGRRAAR